MSANAQVREDDAPAKERWRLRIRGTVQGVGFRPFLYRLAREKGLAGFAMNDGDGVSVEVEGAVGAIAGFIADVRQRAPANAVVAEIGSEPLPVVGELEFRIQDSSLAAAPVLAIPPDLATCPACLAEIFNPTNRRHLYPFTNCTDCGPRFSLIESLPYDRANTAMRHFEMCARCRAEYGDPANRRFHAEPNACPDCGPQLTLMNASGETLATRHASLIAAANAIRDGKIVALKGLGGFHLVVDARNEVAVERLRERKRRPDKPFAVMYPGLESVRRDCHVLPEEEAILTGRERPIVLLRLRNENSGICEAVAPGNPNLGVMLPYTPLHHILMAELGFPIVATSGNRSDEPIAIDNEEALERLSGIADVFLLYDRPILRPIDDSIVRVFEGEPVLLRRARGYAPESIETNPLTPGILAMGGHLKSTVALTREDGVTLSQHLGDLDTPKARDGFDAAIRDLLSLTGAEPAAVACDLHPDYWSTQQAERLGLPLIRVQHHLAHVCAVMAERTLELPVLGVAWDGTGYGPDGSIWGGEFLQVTDKGWRRVAHLRSFRLPGGDVAMREPRRAAFGLLHEIFSEDAAGLTHLSPMATFSTQERTVLQTMLTNKVNSPLTSSAGRLFDAVAALLGLCQTATYEGQAACMLEWAATDGSGPSSYAFPLITAAQHDGPLIIDWEPALRQIIDDLQNGVGTADIAAAFHAGLANAIAAVAREAGVPNIVLSGGCFQNALLMQQSVAALRGDDFTPHWSARVPSNDGGLALGQAWWASRVLGKGDTPCA